MNFDELKNPVDVTGQFDPADITANKGMACVACFPILFWLPLVACKDSAFGKFYANGVLCGILALIPFIGGLLSALVSLVLGVATIAAFIFTIYNASQDKAKYIPVIGQLIEVFK